jgi:MFS family permease
MSLVTGVLVYALLSYSITSNMLIPLLPALEHAYGTSPVTAVWVTLAALLAGAAFVPTLCRLGDTLGWKKSMTIVGLGCLLVGGVIAAVSTTVPLLLLGRAFQGVSLLAFPMIAGIVNDEFTVTRRKVAISLLSATLFFGSGAGGVIAGLLVEHAASFRIVFWMSALLPLLAIPLVAVFIPRGRGPAPDAPANRWRVIDLATSGGLRPTGDSSGLSRAVTGGKTDLWITRRVFRARPQAARPAAAVWYWNLGHLSGRYAARGRPPVHAAHRQQAVERRPLPCMRTSRCWTSMATCRSHSRPIPCWCS